MRVTDCLFTLAFLSATTCGQTTPAEKCAAVAESCTESSDCCVGSYCDDSDYGSKVCYPDGWTCVFKACKADADCCKEHPECRMAGFELGCMDKANGEEEDNGDEKVSDSCTTTGEDCSENPCCDASASCIQIECAPFPTCEPNKLIQ